MEETVITIDPGIRGTGLAIWSLKNWETDTVPLATFVITPPSDEEWVIAIGTIFDQIDPIFDEYKVVKAYCEFPQYFSSGKGHAATSDGKIFKLACLVGVFMGIMLVKNCILFPINVTAWKGQLPKEAVISRLIRIEPKLSQLNIDSHAWDAVGIAFHLKGKFTVLNGKKKK